MKKRSIKLSGQSTSITLEDGFWQALKVIALQEETSVAALIHRIDQQRSIEETSNLSSLIRLYILNYFWKQPPNSTPQTASKGMSP